MTKHLTAASLALNVVVLAALVWALQRQAPQNTAHEDIVARDQPGGSVNDSPLLQLHARLSGASLNEKERASLMLAYLQERYGESDEQLQRSASFCDSPVTVLDRAREEALASLGNGAVEDPDFGCLFRPLEREYAELGPQKQVAVHRLLESYYREIKQTDSRTARKDSYKKLLTGTANVLSGSEYDEFMLRASPLAKSIRRMNLELDESRSRTLVQLVAKDERLSQLVLGNADESRDASFQSNQIAELLGSERYVRFAYSVDPLGAGAPVGKLGKSLMRDASTNAQKRGSYGSSPMPDSKR